jgi:hypothetical protein
MVTSDNTLIQMLSLVHMVECRSDLNRLYHTSRYVPSVVWSVVCSWYSKVEDCCRICS